jgi:phage tail-like protein
MMGTNIIWGQQLEINIVLKRGVVANRGQLYAWLNQKEKKDILIDLCNEEGAPLVRWKVNKAMPYKMEGPTLNADGNEIAIESIEMIADELHLEYF